MLSNPSVDHRKYPLVPFGTTRRFPDECYLSRGEGGSTSPWPLWVKKYPVTQRRILQPTGKHSFHSCTTCPNTVTDGTGTSPGESSSTPGNYDVTPGPRDPTYSIPHLHRSFPPTFSSTTRVQRSSSSRSRAPVPLPKQKNPTTPHPWHWTTPLLRPPSRKFSQTPPPCNYSFWDSCHSDNSGVGSSVAHRPLLASTPGGRRSRTDSFPTHDVSVHLDLGEGPDRIRWNRTTPNKTRDSSGRSPVLGCTRECPGWCPSLFRSGPRRTPVDGRRTPRTTCHSRNVRGPQVTLVPKFGGPCLRECVSGFKV